MQIESNDDIQGNDVNVDVTVIQQELETLRASYADLEGKYNTLNSEYSQYKLDIEFNKEMNDSGVKFPSEIVEVLRRAKSTMSDEDYASIKNSMINAHIRGGNIPRGSQGASTKGANTNTNTFEQILKNKGDR